MDALRAQAPRGAALSAALELAGVRVRAPGRKDAPLLLGPLDLRVEEREHVLLVGPSGAGKTTLLRAVAGLARLEAGEVHILGRQASTGGRHLLAPAERGVGLLFQGGALWPHMSARRHLDFVLAHRQVPRRERAARARELLELVDLAGFEKRKPATLSGGEGQRLALARALAGGEKLLLLDEPLGPLDADRRRELLRRLGALQEELGLTILHVTHDPAEAARIASRTLVLEAGRLVGDRRSA